MIALTDSVLSAIKGSIGRELLTELWAAPWDKSQLKTIDELGAAHGTNTGTKRTRNEDRLAIARVTAHNQERFTVALVCDGVGGSEMGDVAATLAIAAFIDELSQVRTFLPLSDLLDQLIRKMDTTVQFALGGRGTTTASIVLATSTGQFVAANIGDSRIFTWKPNALGFQQISIDDTIENELLNLAVKDISVLDARGLRGRLSQAIGEADRTSNDLRIDVLSQGQFENSGMVLATDGAWKSVEAGFESLVFHAASAADAMRRVISFSAWTGGVDNVSIIAIENMLKFAKGEDEQAPLSSKTPKTTVWVCDSKITICDSTRSANTKHHAEDHSPKLKAEATNNKQKTKSASRRKASNASPKKNGTQLSFAGDVNAESKQDNRKLKAEISTDQDSEVKP